MSETTLRVVPVDDLLNLKFYVPSYQRGYRWTPLQVTELLNDIWQFREESQDGSKEEFYCLQPLVVAPQNGEWVLIDGQQRVTTIYLILSYLDLWLKGYNKNKYQLRYETRLDSGAFLEKITAQLNTENIDFFHISQAYIAIDSWFKGKGGTVPMLFLATLVSDDKVGKNVKVIWYEIGDDVDPIEIFTRINIGKIPLTNSELIKSLFLGKMDKELGIERITLKQIQIASEWDKIETTLQDDAFWHFIYEGNAAYENRIEYIFDLMEEKNTEQEAYYTFHKFNKRITTSGDLPVEWLNVKKYFQTFEEWYNDRDLYHLVGYLIATGYSIIALKTQSRSRTKANFIAFLKDEIKKRVNYNLDDLEYDDRAKVKRVLLLFNIQTIIRNVSSTLRFPFNKYKTEKWDFEHVRSIKSDKPAPNKQRNWLSAVAGYFTGKDKMQEQLDALEQISEDTEKILATNVLKALQKDKILQADFDKIYDNILAHFGEDTEPDDIDSIYNLVLLDASTNRSYKNAVFPVKRRIINENDMNGTFVPICTRNVFLKSYSKRIGNVMFWQIDDALAYRSALYECLADYLPILQPTPQTVTL